MAVLDSQRTLHEFNAKGFGREIVEDLDKHGFYSLQSLLEWEYVIRNNMEALTLLFNIEYI